MPSAWISDNQPSVRIAGGGTTAPQGGGAGGGLDYLRNLRQTRMDEAGVSGLESDLAAEEARIAGRVGEIPGEVEALRGRLAASPSYTKIEGEMAEKEEALKAHYYRLKDETFNPESPHYVFARPTEVEAAVYGNLAPERAYISSLGLTRERMIEQDERLGDRLASYLGMLLEADKLKLASKQSAYERALKKISDELDLEMSITKGRGGTTGRTAEENADIEGMAQAYFMGQIEIDQIPAASLGAVLARAKQLKEEEDRQVAEEERGFTSGDTGEGFSAGGEGDYIIGEPEKPNVFQRIYRGLLGR